MIIEFINYTINGALLGLLYSLVAMGFVVIYRASKVFNMAIGEMIVLGAFLLWWAIQSRGMHPALGIAVALGISVLIIAALLVLMALSAATYGPVAALLAEMFPARVRYSSMSIPYHIGAGYLGGFLPLIAGVIVARTGDIYAGLWYTWVVVAFGLVVAWWGIPGGPPTDFADD